MAKKVKVTQLCPTPCDHMDYTVLGISRIEYWRGMEATVPFSRGSSHPGTEPRPPTFQVGSLPSEPPGNTSKR